MREVFHTVPVVLTTAAWWRISGNTTLLHAHLPRSAPRFMLELRLGAHCFNPSVALNAFLRKCWRLTQYRCISSRSRGLDMRLEDIKCGVCYEILVKVSSLLTEQKLQPMVLRCGHSFCEFCAHESLNLNDSCPTCRRKSVGICIQSVLPPRTLAGTTSWSSASTTSSMPVPHRSERSTRGSPRREKVSRREATRVQSCWS